MVSRDTQIAKPQSICSDGIFVARDTGHTGPFNAYGSLSNPSVGAIGMMMIWNHCSRYDQAMSTPSATAVHEAGHVVIGTALQIEVVSADLTPQRSSRGHETVGGVEFGFTRKAGEEMSDAVERKMTFAFAGVCAEHHILGIEAASLEGIGKQSDDLDVAEGAAKCARRYGLSEEEIGRRWRIAWDRSNELTQRFRNEIVKLAKKLDEHRLLSSEQIHEALKETCFL